MSQIVLVIGVIVAIFSHTPDLSSLLIHLLLLLILPTTITEKFYEHPPSRAIGANNYYYTNLLPAYTNNDT